MNLLKYSLFAILCTAAPLAFGAINMSLSGLLEFVVYIVIVALIFWCVWWFINYVGIPEPFNKVVRVVLGLIALIIIVNLLLGLVGSPMFSFR